MTVLEFWDLTPRETYMAIEAWVWRDRRAQRQQAALAWQTAAYTRAKKLPSPNQVLSTGTAKPLAGKELQRRRQEFAEMTAGVDLSKIGKPMKQEK